jgi:glyoxalase-like protein
MPRCELDHLVVVAGTRDAGAAWVEKMLGVNLEPGGEHPLMGTHNALLRLGQTQYLEVIAINPSAPAPGRPRWFEMDRPPAGLTPVLTTWVARTDDIGSAVAACPTPLGEIESMSRGPFEWLVTVRPDGGLSEDGLVPSLIEWRSAQHPASLLPDRGCSLANLEAFHPDGERVRLVLAGLGLAGSIVAKPLPMGARPYLVAQIKTPSGVVALGGPRASP